MSDKYIHYGHKHFDINLFCPISNREIFTKPFGGLWASRIDAEYGWKDWNNREHFKKCEKENSFTFCLSDNAKILTINSMDDLEDLPHLENDFFLGTLDFEKLLNFYDAIEVNISSDYRLYHGLYGWDCDSILVMNPEVIREI